jgi:hypothetical protein
MKTSTLLVFLLLSSLCLNAQKSAKMTNICVSTTVDAGPDKLICPTGGSVQIGTPPEIGYTFEWSPTTGLDNPNISNPIASPTVGTIYTVTKKSQNFIQNGDFEQGNTLYTNDYTYYTNFWDCGINRIITDPTLQNSFWCHSLDHTTTGDKMLMIDGKCGPNGQYPNPDPLAPSVIWRQNVNLGTGNYFFSAWFFPINYCGPIYLRINGQTVGNQIILQSNYCQWKNLSFSINYTDININPLIELVAMTGGSGSAFDFAVDDIYLGCLPTTDQVTVNVCNPPAITTQSYFQEGLCSPPPAQYIQPIVPNSNNQFCYYWECGGTSHIFSNIPNANNEWYINDIPITSSGYSPSYGSVNIDNAGELIHSGVNFAGSNNYLKFQVKNTTFGYQNLSEPTYVYYAPFIGPNYDDGGQYKANYTHLYNPPIRAGINATYTWSVPGCVVDNLSTSNPDVQITFPANVPTTGVTGSLTVTNSICNNGIIQMLFTYNNSLKSSNIDENLTNIFPNPATTSINLVSKSTRIVSVEIFDLSGILLKRIKNIPTEKLELKVSDLKQGIYNCRIITESGIENQKFIIKR